MIANAHYFTLSLTITYLITNSSSKSYKKTGNTCYLWLLLKYPITVKMTRQEEVRTCMIFSSNQS